MSLNWIHHFSSAVIIFIEGQHSERYLNARLSNDVKSLKIGSYCSAAALTPQGRVQAYGTLWRIDIARFIYVCDMLGDEDPETLRAALAQYIVADRVTVTLADPSLTLLSTNFSQLIEEQAEGTASLPNQSLFCLKRKRLNSAAWDIILPTQQARAALSELKSEVIRLKAEEWHAKCISLSIPNFPHELNATSLFAEAPISDSISYTKGCYVGQEVMERVDARGRTPKILRALEIEGVAPPQIGEQIMVEVDSSSAVVGTVVSSASYENKQWCFALIKNREYAQPFFTVGNARGRLIPT